MFLRKLKIEDAPLMLEWMHDKTVTLYLRTEFASMTIADAESFIRMSWESAGDIHLAIVSDEDVYMGTVSLKNIDQRTAECAITVRSDAMRRGYAWFGMESILRMAFEEMDLECVYWCVSRENTRAVRFYDKHHFHEVVDVPKTVLERYHGVDNLKWYSALKGDNYSVGDSVAGCRIIHINTIQTLNSGELSFFESFHDTPFEIKRIYYITKVPEGIRRGFHAHKELKQILFCPYGRIQLTLESAEKREDIILSDPSVGILIEKPTWREMLWLQKDSVLCVAASDYYDADDYIRDYQEFKKAIQ